MLSKTILVIILVSLVIPPLSADHADVQKFNDLIENMEAIDDPFIEKEVEAKLDVIRQFFPYQPEVEALRKREGYIRRIPYAGEQQLIMKRIDYMRKEDPKLAVKFAKLYKKSRNFENAAIDVLKYIMNAYQYDVDFIKAKKIVHSLEDILMGSIKNFRTINV